MSDTQAAPQGELEVSPNDMAVKDFYFLMTALVIPRPIGWISTISASGVRNLAPYSYFNLMGSDPFYVAFGSTGVKDSLTNIREVPQFVANIVSVDLIERMNFTSGDFPREEDEFGWAGLTPVPAAKVRPFRVGEAKAHLECEVQHIHSDGNTHIVLAKVVHAHVAAAVFKDGPRRSQAARPDVPAVRRVVRDPRRADQRAAPTVEERQGHEGAGSDAAHFPKGVTPSRNGVTHETSIVGYFQDENQDWVAKLKCGHNQHVRHNPPWINRPVGHHARGTRRAHRRRAGLQEMRPGCAAGSARALRTNGHSPQRARRNPEEEQ